MLFIRLVIASLNILIVIHVQHNTGTTNINISTTLITKQMYKITVDMFC